MHAGGYRRLLRYLPFLAVALAVAAHGAAPKKHPAATPQHQREHAADFDAFARALDTSYPFFDRAAWKRTRASWRLHARRAATQEEFLAALEGAAAELRDDAVTLSAHSRRFGRTVPYEG